MLYFEVQKKLNRNREHVEKHKENVENTGKCRNVGPRSVATLNIDILQKVAFVYIPK